jgi:hypothetical protein
MRVLGIVRTPANHFRRIGVYYNSYRHLIKMAPMNLFSLGGVNKSTVVVMGLLLVYGFAVEKSRFALTDRGCERN